MRHDADVRLQFHDPESGEDLPAHEEMRERVEQEVAARRAAEARLRESEARLEGEAAAHRTTKARLEEEVAARDERIAELESRLGSGSWPRKLRSSLPPAPAPGE